MGEYEYHANPIDWHKPSTAPAKGGKPVDLGVFRPPTVGRVGSLFNKIEVTSQCVSGQPTTNKPSTLAVAGCYPTSSWVLRHWQA